tara:strand:- start:163 stop:438 length:276 start_codon:yes stop_codon:yes gene_type:complete
MTIKRAKAILRGVGFTVNFNRDWDEFRYNILGGTEEQAGYEATAEDAVGSALSDWSRSTFTPQFTEGLGSDGMIQLAEFYARNFHPNGTSK